MRILSIFVLNFFVLAPLMCQDKKENDAKEPSVTVSAQSDEQQQKTAAAKVATDEQQTEKKEKSSSEDKGTQEAKPVQEKKLEEGKAQEVPSKKPETEEKKPEAEEKKEVEAKGEKEAKPETATSEVVKPEAATPEAVKPEEKKPEETRQEPKQGEVKPGEVKPEEKPEEKKDEKKSPEVKSEEAKPEEKKTEEAKVVAEPAFPKKAEFEHKDAPDTPESMSEAFTQQEPEGIDTVTLEEPQGNWLYKRTWWERAQGRYEKIRTLVDSVWESRMNFFIQRSDFDRNVLDPFYTSIGIGQGELQETIKEMIESLEKNGISSQERELYEKLEAEKQELRQLALDVESVADFDDAIDKVLHAFMDQINRVRDFEKQAWGNFKEIAQVLSDTKAQELYYMMDGMWQNIKNVGVYIEKDLTPHLAKLIEDAKNQIIRVQDQIKALKEKGVSFKLQAELIAQKEEESAQKELQEEKQQEKKLKKKMGWIELCGSYLFSLWELVVYVARLPYDMIFSSKK